MLDKSDTNSSEKVIIKTCVHNAYENFGSSVPIPINQNVAVKLINN